MSWPSRPLPARPVSGAAAPGRDAPAARVEVAIGQRAGHARRIDQAVEDRGGAPLAVADLDRSAGRIAEENAGVDAGIVGEGEAGGTPGLVEGLGRSALELKPDLTARVVVLVLEV